MISQVFGGMENLSFVRDIKGYWMLYLPVVFAVIAGFSLDPIATISCGSTDAYAWNG